MERLLCLLVLASLVIGSPVFAAVGENAEIQLTLATIEFQAKNYPKCRQMINEILKNDEKNGGARELLALIQSQMKDDNGAAATYERLLKDCPPLKAPGYHFELAMIRFKQKKNNEARRHFDLAAGGLFNAGTSHFYLGVMDFSAKEWRGARHHFTASLTYTDGKSMEPVTRYYLANAYSQLGKTEAAVHSYYEVSDAATSNSGINNLPDGIRTNALKELKALDANQRYASITLQQQFDSNVQSNPSEVENPTAATGQRSGKSNLSIAAGYSTSPTRTIQITPSINYSTNYNYNYLARTFNFMNFTPALFVVYKPYARLSAGLKADGTFTMQNMLDPNESTRDLKYRPFGLTGDVGPVLKYELTPRISLGAETYWRPKRFYLDPAIGSSRRSGGGAFAKLSSEFVSGYNWWNPLLYVSYEFDHPGGTDFRMTAWGGGVANSVAVTGKLTLTGSVDAVATDYTDTVPKRDDVAMNFRIAGTYPLVTHWMATADVTYTDNESSLDTSFKYNRWLGSVGATYSF